MSKVVVAMSGGVDSSVAAALLKEQGHEVIGVMLRLWSEPGSEETNRCCAPDSMAQARRVAAILNIPFYVVDAKEVFYSKVVRYFLEGCAQGVTPNPCLVCNIHIRWGFLLDHALALGADFMATGHYARLKEDPSPSPTSAYGTGAGRAGGGKIKLLRAVDRLKDQSYVLHGLTQAQLARSLFPLGGHPKGEVRKLAESFKLPTASRPDSQDLCFLAGGNYREFLRRNAPSINTPGPILSRLGQVLGQHTGLADYTIGQRKGLGIAAPAPLYVVAKEAERNRIIVGGVDELRSQRLAVKDVNWIGGETPAARFRAEVKIRYTARAIPAEVQPREGGRVEVLFDSPQRGITPGQSAVFYAGEELLGGGVIV